MKKKVMQRAWELARQGVKQFGGKAREYLAVSLRMAWAEIKEESTMEEKIKEFIELYRIIIIKSGIHKGKIQILNSTQIGKHPEDKEFIKENKQAFIKAIEAKEEEKRRAFEEYKAKINAIDGLEEIRNAKSDLESWHNEFERSFSGECGGFGVRQKPNYDFEAMYAKYPRAKAFLQAESYEYASHYVKSGAGKKAKEKIINGEDYVSAISEMEKEWTDYCNEHAFD